MIEDSLRCRNFTSQVLRARAILGKQVMSRTCVIRYSALYATRCCLVLPLGQQNSRPVPWLQGAEADPIPCSWQFGSKGDRAIANLDTLLSLS